MNRVSRPSRASAIVVATAASVAAMTAHNIYRARKAERDHPPTGRFVTVDGVKLHYIDRGEGPPVVLLHGNVVTAEDFRTSGVLELLARRHRVIAFDRPGYGYSDRPHGSAWSARAQADLLKKAFDVVDIKRPIVLGHSWGTAVALAMALNHPNDVKGLVLLSGYYYPTLRMFCCLHLRLYPSLEISCAFRSLLSWASCCSRCCLKECSRHSLYMPTSQRAPRQTCRYGPGRSARRAKTASQ